MKVQKRTSVSGEFARKGEDIKNGDIITINNEGEVVSGDYGDRNVFKVETKNGEKLLTFNQTSINYLIDAYGDETSKWVGKKIKVWIVKSSIAGKWKDVVYLSAPDWIEGKDGLQPPKGDIPVIEEDEEEVNVKDIPF